MKKAFIIMLDALRHDYINPSYTPFLASLLEKSNRATVIETYAFQTRPAYFAGLTPDQSEICHLFEFNPTISPFSFLKPLTSILRKIDPWGFFSVGRGFIREIARRKDRASGNLASADVLNTHEVPLHLLPFFAFSERAYTDTPDVFKERKTFFDYLRSKGLSCSWIGYPRHFGSTASILKTFHSTAEADITYLHFSELDWIGHKFGPESEELHQALSQLDQVLAKLLTPYLESRQIVLFGDHGMVSTTYKIDLIDRLQKLPLTSGIDYIPFIDSTQARFWFLNEKSRSLILDTLSKIEGLKLLTPEERKNLGIWERRSKFGEEIFSVTGPGLIHPSFFTHREAPIGMHGYLPHIEENKTQILFYPSSAPKDLGTIQMTDIFLLMREFINPQPT